MKDATDITILLDRSGSMNAIKSDVIGGLNAFLAGQKAVPGECRLTLVQFDDVNPQDVVVANRPIAEVEDFTDQSFVPRGCTPLLDALGRLIVATGERFKALPEDERPDKIVFVIMTDGLENASKEYNRARVFEMVKHQTDVYKWNFIYLGANQDAIAVGGQIGTQSANAATYDPSMVQMAYAATSANVAQYRTSNKISDLNWTDDQRKKLNKKHTKGASK